MSQHNFRQILSSLKFHIPDDQIDAVAAKYADDDGFNYWRFLGDLDPPSKESLQYEYPNRIKRIREAFNKARERTEAIFVIHAVEGVMDYIKHKVGCCNSNSQNKPSCLTKPEQLH